MGDTFNFMPVLPSYLPRILRLPSNTVITVGGKNFKLVGEVYVTGTRDDFDAVAHLLPVRFKTSKSRKGRL